MNNNQHFIHPCIGNAVQNLSNVSNSVALDLQRGTDGSALAEKMVNAANSLILTVRRHQGLACGGVCVPLNPPVPVVPYQNLLQNFIAQSPLVGYSCHDLLMNGAVFTFGPVEAGLPAHIIMSDFLGPNRFMKHKQVTLDGLEYDVQVHKSLLVCRCGPLRAYAVKTHRTIVAFYGLVENAQLKEEILQLIADIKNREL